MTWFEQIASGMSGHHFCQVFFWVYDLTAIISMGRRPLNSPEDDIYVQLMKVTYMI